MFTKFFQRLAVSVVGLAASTFTMMVAAQETENASSSVGRTAWSLEGIASSAARNTALPAFSAQFQGQKSIMLTLSLDHQLFLKAYNDYSDIYPPPNGDGVPDNTYVHDFNYVGYFDSNICYAYTNDVFHAVSRSADKYCDDTADAGGGWSGNFLNWATMTRMDLVRFVLYGGYRSTDEPASATSPSLTILERAYLPQDAHSFAKYYPGDDISRLTDGLPSVCDGSDRMCEGYTFCNTTRPDQSLKDKLSQDFEVMALPPLMRAVKGNYSLWASNERYQCITKAEIPAFDYKDNLVALAYETRGKNGNIPDRTQIYAFGDVPQPDQVVDHIVRVKVCDLGAPVQEGFCTPYTEQNLKPEGILQEKGKNGEVHFGLLTGSYSANKSFGALRKNVSSFEDELNSDGTFVYPSFSKLVEEGVLTPIVQTSSGLELKDSIVGNLNSLRIVDYKFRSAGDEPEDRWQWSGTYHQDLSGSVGNCWWGETDFKNGHCRNWGNPFSEILAESYLYFAQRPKLSINEINDEGLLPGLTVAQWPAATPVTNQNGNQGLAQAVASSCPNFNVLAFNSSSVSYDSGTEHAADSSYNNLAGATTGTLFGATAAKSVAELTKFIGEQELDSAKRYFVGKVSGGTSPGDDNGQCTAKFIPGSDLSLVSGTCTEAPNLQGSFWGAGLAHYVYTNDIRVNTPQKDTITTYGISLSGQQPKIELRLPPGAADSATVQIIPACRNRGRSGTETKGNCSLVDFKVVQAFTESNNHGIYYVGWEDTEQGGDYDLDLSGIITVRYEADSDKPLKVGTQITYESAVNEMHFGFVIVGTNDERTHFPSRVRSEDEEAVIHSANGFQTDDNNPANDDNVYDWLMNNQPPHRLEEFNRDHRVDADTANPGVDGCSAPSCITDSGNSRLQITSFSLEPASNIGEIKSPLEYAATWGSFIDKGYGGSRDNNGILDGDLERNPGSYSSVSNPAELKETLAKTVDQTINKQITGTGASVATTALTGEGLILSSFFIPEVGSGANTVQWAGHVNGLFRAYDETWEDSAVPFGVRTNDDYIVRFRLGDQNTTVFDRYEVINKQGPVTPVNLRLVSRDNPYEDLKSVWSARDQLASLPQAQITTQRDYDDASDLKRYIFTSVDTDGDGHALDNDTFDFVADLFDEDGRSGTGGENLGEPKGLGQNNFRLIDAGTAENSKNVVDYIRGLERISGFRNRTIELTENGVTREKPWLLGGVVHSTPAMVGRPNELYGSSRIGDGSYTKFRNAYANRRLVTYVGANDGMLHAFNGGFAVPYDLEENIEGSGFIYQKEPATGSAEPYPLGAELWAYVPYNLLPHLKWLTDPNFQHVYFVDSSVNQFDVNIFPHSDKHPEGWGTIIVVGMRFGGTDTIIDVNGEETGGTRTLRSAYMIFDVTDPESPPTLLGEITHPELGYTMGDIDVASFRDPKSDGTFTISDGNPLPKNQWFLVFGSGPNGGDALAKATSDQSAKLFTLDLNKLRTRTVDLKKVELPDSDKSYVGGVTVMDWNDDFDDDMIYFGTVGTGTDAGDPKGSLRHAQLQWSNDTGLAVTTGKLLSDVNLPFSREPLAIKESAYGRYWIYAATGEFVVRDHVDNIGNNKIFGVMVNSNTGLPWMTTGSVAISQLKDVSEIVVNTNVTEGPANADGLASSIRTFAAIDGGLVTTPEAIATSIRDSSKGWVKNQRSDELSNTRPFFYGSTLGITTMVPTAEGCSPLGKGRLYVLNMFNGLPQTESDAMVLIINGIPTPVGQDDSRGGTLADVIELDTPVNDTSEEGKPVIKCVTGCDLVPPGNLPPGVPTRRSWREISQ